MATRTIWVCDTCEATADVATYEVKSGDRRVKLDLCGEHGAPLADLLATAPTPAAKPVDDEKAARRRAARERRAAEKAATESAPAA